MTNKVTLSQSSEQQAALFGHIVSSEKIFEVVQQAMEEVGNFSWINSRYTVLWNAIIRHQRVFGTHPTESELRNAPEVFEHEHKDQLRFNSELDAAMKLRFDHSFEPLSKQLRDWQRMTLIDKQVSEMARLYNQGDVAGSVEKIESLALRLNTLSEGISNRFEHAWERVAREEVERLAESGKILKYGVQFFDDILGGILPKELVVIGAKAGAGKTQLVSKIARSNSEYIAGVSENPKRVSMFALEAEDGEIERRIKYEICGRLWRTQNPGAQLERGLFSYKNWRMGRLEEYLGKYSRDVDQHFKKMLPEFRTFYRTNGDFDVQDMEKSIIKVAKNTDLIIIDHLHYIDVNDENENSAHHKIVKKLRDLVLHFSVPIIVVAHLRKDWGGGKNKPIIPDLADFHGSSSIGKIATTGLIIGRARGHVASPAEYPRSYPTFMRVTKDRFGGLLDHVGVSFFDPVTGGYRPKYALGSLSKGDSKWTADSLDDLPYWAKENGKLHVTTVD